MKLSHCISRALFITYLILAYIVVKVDGVWFLKQFRDEHGRFLPGSLTQINQILAGLTLTFDVSDIEPISGIRASADLSGIPIFVSLTALVAPDGDPANCSNLQILGDVALEGYFDSPRRDFELLGQECVDTKTIDCDSLTRDQFLSDLGDLKFYNRYTIEIDAVDISLQCDLDLVVILDEVRTAPDGSEVALIDVDTDEWNKIQPKDQREFNFTTTTAKIEQKVFAYSENFLNSTPSFSRPDNCSGTTVGDLTFGGKKLLVIKPIKEQIVTGDPVLDAIIQLAFLFIGDFEEMDMTEDVLAELSEDPTLVTGPINKELCGLVFDIATLISDLILDNPLTNQTGQFVLNDPFVDDGNGIPALELEDAIHASAPETVDLLNLKEPNFFVDLVFPDKNYTTTVRPGSSTLGEVFNFFADPLPDNSTEVDPLLRLLSDLLGFNVTNAGTIVDLDVLEIVYRLFNDTDGDPTLLVVNTSLTLLDVITIDLKVTVIQLLLNVTPPVNDTILADPNVLGEQTIIFPSFRLGDLGFRTEILFETFINNPGDPDDVFLKTPFTYILDEDLIITLEWDNFFSQVAALFAVDLNELLALQFGPLIDEVFDCLFSSFYSTPRVAGATFNADAIRLEITGYTDALAYALTQAVNLIIPIYQPVLPQVVEYLVADLLVNTTLIDPTECALADEAGKNELYDFSTGIFKEISDLATVDLFEQIFSFFDDPDNRVQVLSSPLEFSFGLPENNGYSQRLSFELSRLFIDGVLPPVINDVVLLRVPNTSIYFPQFIENLVDLADVDHPIRFILDFSLNVSAPVAVVPNPGELGPLQFEQTNIIRLSIAFSTIKLILDLYAHFTRYSVESMELGNILSIDCWQGRLNESGGVKQLTGELRSPLTRQLLSFVDIVCNCNNLVIEALADSLSSESGWSTLLNDINFVLDSVGGAIELLYNEDNLERTVTTAQARCEGVEEPPPKTAAQSKFEEEIGQALTLIGMVFGGLSATSVLACSSRFYKRRAGIKRGGLLSVTEEDYEAEHDYEGTSIFNNPLTPNVLRFGVPAVMVVNFGIFLIGHLGDAAVIGIDAEVLGVPFGIDNFQALSVVSSVFKLYEGGAILLAVALFALSIFFPYFKLFCLFMCWLVPPRILSIRARGRVITFLDIVGKWSLVEFFFLVFVLIAFRIEGSSPDWVYLPEEPILKAKLLIEPQINLFTFSIAVLLSLVMGNICMVYHEKIVQQRQWEWRKAKAKEIEEYRKEGTGITLDEDSLKIPVRQWEFTVIPDARDPGARYVFHITNLGIGFMIVIGGITIILLVLASVLPALQIENYGLVSYIIEWSGRPTEYTLSVIEFATITLQEVNAINVVLAIVVVITIVVVPLVEYLLSGAMMLKPVTLGEARSYREIHHILNTWACVDVFVFSIAFACLEVGTVSSALTRSIEQCADIGAFMEDTLVPLGIVSQRDAEASCFALIAIPKYGAFVGVVAVILFNISQYYMTYVFHSYIHDRGRVEVDLLNDPVKYNIVKTKPTPWHKFLASLKLIQFSRKRSHIMSTAVAVGQGIEMGGPAATSNPMWMKNKATEKARKKVEEEQQQQERMEKYELLHPRNKLLNDLTLFLRKVDPGREHLAEALVDEAFARPGGLQRLNEKLMDKYGATVTINI